MTDDEIVVALKEDARRGRHRTAVVGVVLVVFAIAASGIDWSSGSESKRAAERGPASTSYKDIHKYTCEERPLDGVDYSECE